ncbi:hypothetical protein E2C01_087070 [Portunus trituberculatus]|uniref:Uncharacterized protein n=1 Tax=Portunus trituberculatus TaxID=210409 RepID=A0A5B7J763_PORTR|nr:hypothetical protein [Portunus trituberculatus]
MIPTAASSTIHHNYWSYDRLSAFPYLCCGGRRRRASVEVMRCGAARLTMHTGSVQLKQQYSVLRRKQESDVKVKGEEKVQETVMV